MKEKPAKANKIQNTSEKCTNVQMTTASEKARDEFISFLETHNADIKIIYEDQILCRNANVIFREYKMHTLYNPIFLMHMKRL